MVQIHKNWAWAALATAAMALPLTLSLSTAQTSDSKTKVAVEPQVGPPPGGPGFGPGQPGLPPGQPGGGRMMQMGGGPGGTAMIADASHLYILQGNRLFKVNKDDLKVTKEGALPGGVGMAPPRDGATTPGRGAGPGGPPPSGDGGKK